jgi:hypothetical protein
VVFKASGLAAVQSWWRGPRPQHVGNSCADVTLQDERLSTTTEINNHIQMLVLLLHIECTFCLCSQACA